MSRPRMPIELVEKIIDASRDDPRTLLACSLICRPLVSRSRLNLYRNVRIRRRTQLQSLLATFHSSPELCALVKRVDVYEMSAPSGLTETALAVLLPELPRLGMWNLQGVAVGSSSLAGRIARACFPQYTSMHTLSLSYNDSFASSSQAVAFLCSLSSLRSLVLVAVRLRKRAIYVPRNVKSSLHLSSLDADHCDQLLVHDLIQAACSTLEVIAVAHSNATNGAAHSWLLPMPSDTSVHRKLHTLIIAENRIWGHDSQPVLHDIIQCLRGNHFPNIAVFRIESRSSNALHFSDVFHRHVDEFRQFCEALEHTLIRIPSFRSLAFALPHANRHTTRIWKAQLLSLFPSLHQRGSFQVDFSQDYMHLNDQHTGAIIALCLSPDSKWVLSSDYSSTILWDCHTGHARTQWDRNADYAGVYTPSFAFSPDGRLCARPGLVGPSSVDQCIVIWDLETNEDVTTLDIPDSIHPNREMTALPVPTPTSNRTMTIIWGTNGVVAVFDLATDRDEYLRSPWTMTAWDATTYALRARVIGKDCDAISLTVGNSAIPTFNVSSDTRWLVCQCSDGSLFLLDTLTGEPYVTPPDQCSNPLPGCSDNRHSRSIYGTKFVNGGCSLASLCRRCSTLHLWDLTCTHPAVFGEPHHIMLDSHSIPDPKEELHFIGISSNGMVAAFWWPYHRDRERGICILPTSHPGAGADTLHRRPITIQATGDGAFLSTSGEHLIVSGAQGTDVYRTKDGKCLATLDTPGPGGHYVSRVEFSEDGETMVVGTSSGSVHAYRFREIIRSGESEECEGEYDVGAEST